MQRRQYRIETMLPPTCAPAQEPLGAALTRDLAALVHDCEGRRLHHAAAELGAAIEEMERAAVDALAAAESVERTAEKIAVLSPQAAVLAGNVRDGMSRIFEACSFQDIAGQRIAKVIGLLTRLDDLLTGALGAAGQTGANGAHLLNGPRLDGAGGHITQDEIDAMFAHPQA